MLPNTGLNVIKKWFNVHLSGGEGKQAQLRSQHCPKWRPLCCSTWPKTDPPHRLNMANSEPGKVLIMCSKMICKSCPTTISSQCSPKCQMVWGPYLQGEIREMSVASSLPCLAERTDSSALQPLAARFRDMAISSSVVRNPSVLSPPLFLKIVDCLASSCTKVTK